MWLFNRFCSVWYQRTSLSKPSPTPAVVRRWYLARMLSYPARHVLGRPEFYLLMEQRILFSVALFPTAPGDTKTVSDVPVEESPRQPGKQVPERSVCHGRNPKYPKRSVRRSRLRLHHLRGRLVSGYYRHHIAGGLRPDHWPRRHLLCAVTVRQPLHAVKGRSQDRPDHGARHGRHLQWPEGHRPYCYISSQIRLRRQWLRPHKYLQG